MKSIIRQIPNFITSLNLVSGSLATIFAIDGHLVWAAIFICVAAVFDFLDGFAARLLKAYSEIGKQLDSLADVVSFGVAPGAILFTLFEFSLFGKNEPIYEISANWFEWMILFSAFLLPVFGAIRLARFNTNTTAENFFRGLPIPANGIFWASLGLMLESPKYYDLLQYIYSTKNLVILAVFMAGMMVITMPMFSLKPHSWALKENWHRYLFLLISLVFLILFNFYGLAFIILLYIILNIVFYVFKIPV
ncbi:MAG: CDP-alcohol phosphatidyltransferase family protein [Prolixibacteraceae bacterium]|nr:CDP-alcohol phosphatidyltransferase family protein [Prolixibacteraceae bacterium]